MAHFSNDVEGWQPAMTDQPTAVEDDDLFAEALIHRDQYSRPLILPPDGGEPVPYARASTFANELDNGSGLSIWKVRTAAIGIARHPDIAAEVASLRYVEPGERPGKDQPSELLVAWKQRCRDIKADKAKLDELVDLAQHRVDDRASWGTAVHAFTDPLASPHVPERMDADVKSYFAAMEKHGIEQSLSERFVVCDELQVAGTFDGAYKVPTALLEAAGYEVDDYELGNHLIGDKKTGSIHEVAVAIQTAVYSRGKLYTPELDGTATREELGVRQDVALLIHIPKGKGETHLYLVDLRLGWAFANVAIAVRDANARKDIIRPLVSTPVLPTVEVVEEEKPKASSFAKACGAQDATLRCTLKFRHRGDHRDGEFTWARTKAGAKKAAVEPVPAETVAQWDETVVTTDAELATIAEPVATVAEPAQSVAEPAATVAEPTPTVDIAQVAADMAAERQRVLDETAARYKAGLAAKAAEEEAKLAARTIAERIADAPTVQHLLDLHAECGEQWTDDDKALATARRNLLLSGIATTEVSA